MTRGWGGRHVMTLRAQWAPRLPVPCGRCGLPVHPDDPWDLGHVVDRALGGTDADGLWPEHARCSRAAGGRLAAQLRRTPLPHTVPTRATRRSWPT